MSIKMEGKKEGKISIEPVEKNVEKWKSRGRQGIEPVEKSVEKWITPCKELL